jgi:hypothetical protein
MFGPEHQAFTAEVLDDSFRQRTLIPQGRNSSHRHFGDIANARSNRGFLGTHRFALGQFV